MESCKLLIVNAWRIRQKLDYATLKFLQAREGVANDATASEQRPARLSPSRAAAAYVLSRPRTLEADRRLGPAHRVATEGLVGVFVCGL